MHSPNFVKFTFKADPDYKGELSIEAHSERFSGHSSGLFNPKEIIAFAASIDQYPLPKDQIFTLSDYRIEPNVKIEVYVINSVGTLGMRVLLAETFGDNKATISIVFTYSEMPAYTKALTDLIQGNTNEAIFYGFPLRAD